MIGFTEKAVCRKIGKTFELAAKEGFHPVEFSMFWLQSDVCKRLAALDFNDIAQSALYQLNSIKMELQATKVVLLVCESDYSDIMFWAGYLFMYWIYQDEIEGNQIAEAYDVEGILARFDTLHTLSCKTAIEEIKCNLCK